MTHTHDRYIKALAHMAKLVHVEQLMSDDDHNKVQNPPTTFLHIHSHTQFCDTRARTHTHTAGEELESSVLQQSGHVLP